jgi:hypothetical protein
MAIKKHTGFRSVQKALSAEERREIPASKFGLPGAKKYPLNDASHARNALARASQQFNAGGLSGSQKAEIDAKAHQALGKGKKK